jgi:ubiquinone/menaquinone biosynthesis C-methylase UbiE
MEVTISDFVRGEYLSEHIVSEYAEAVDNIGLWDSEKIIFSKHLKKTDNIIDIGCGAGRTTIALKNLGYENIHGVDLSKVMIEQAKKLSEKYNLEIDFKEGDATSLDFEDNVFDSAIFSFNGIMTIPTYDNRLTAMKEAFRVLKKGGIFIFTTHERYGKHLEHKSHWDKQELLWEESRQDSRLYEFGDIIFTKQGIECFVHIPDKAEVKKLIKDSGFRLVKSSLRSDICEERPEILEYSVECIFWVVEKQ